MLTNVIQPRRQTGHMTRIAVQHQIHVARIREAAKLMISVEVGTLFVRLAQLVVHQILIHRMAKTAVTLKVGRIG